MRSHVMLCYLDFGLLWCDFMCFVFISQNFDFFIHIFVVGLRLFVEIAHYPEINFITKLDHFGIFG